MLENAIYSFYACLFEVFYGSVWVCACFVVSSYKCSNEQSQLVSLVENEYINRVSFNFYVFYRNVSYGMESWQVNWVTLTFSNTIFLAIN